MAVCPPSGTTACALCPCTEPHLIICYACITWQLPSTFRELVLSYIKVLNPSTMRACPLLSAVYPIPKLLEAATSGYLPFWWVLPLISGADHCCLAAPFYREKPSAGLVSRGFSESWEYLSIDLSLGFGSEEEHPFCSSSGIYG